MSYADSNPLPVRKCNCSGNCGGKSNPISRREFIGLVGVSGAAALLATPAWGAFELPANELEAWRKSLFSPTNPRRYLSNRHTDARMHLGGIGTGNFELGADGQLTTWQLFNTLRDGQVPFHFVVKAGGTTRLLQTTGGPDWPRVKAIELTGEYPIATLRFQDADLPVDLELQAFSPFAPLDSLFSSIPLAAFVFRIRNRSSQRVAVSLAGFMQNPVGYDAAGNNDGLSNPCFGGNINEALDEGKLRGILMRAEAGREPTLDHPVTVFTLKNVDALKAPPPDRPSNLRLTTLDGNRIPLADAEGSKAVIWLEEAPANLNGTLLESALEAVRAGATLVLSGASMPLLEMFGAWTGGKPIANATVRTDIIFEDFERGYDNWKVEGEAFGKAPASGTLPNQQEVSGFLGKGLVNTYLKGDSTTGRLISKEFQIERRFIRFLIGGGRYEGTQIRLLADGKVVRATSGKDNERLEPALWDVAALDGQTAHIEIVDEQQGGWGHINIDQIEFSDLPGSRQVMEVLEQLLPVRFSGLTKPGAGSGKRDVGFENLVLKPGTTRNTTPSSDKSEVFKWEVGKGNVALVSGPVLVPADAGVVVQRQKAYACLCELAGVKYVPCEGQHPKSPGFGSLALATLAEKARVLLAFNDWPEAWGFVNSESVPDSKQAARGMPTPIGRTLYGGVAASIDVPAGETAEVPFLLTWHYPNKFQARERDPAWMGCHYATRWADARAVLREVAGTFAEARKRTELFTKTFYDSTLPYWLLDCLTANAAILRHIGIVFRIANGDTYGWEGSNGCCDPTCTHVWGYEQTLSRLFPDLERDMRRIDFKHQQRGDGGVNNRTEVPSPPHPTGEQPFADGHASCILKAYREALNSPDPGLFQEYWPHIKRGVEYLIGRDAKASSGKPMGVLQDDQWNTYDEALHGITTFISGYYLAALRAGEEWARRIGDQTTADQFHEVFAKGQQKLVELCWNGEYFQQYLPDYQNRHGEVGPGCMSDQLIGQWWAHQLGLGYLFPKERVVAALKAVFKYNFKTDLTGWKHAPRAFAGEKDKGLIICTWPKGGRPAGVMLYSDEVWTGIEYQVAAHMIYEGLLEEGFAITKAARDRYDGLPRPPIQRNPWNEIECGGHYARAMSSWSLLLALSGWECDGPRKVVRFTPRHSPENFKSCFVGPEGWGTSRQTRTGKTQRNELSVTEGKLIVKDLHLSPSFTPAQVVAELRGQPVISTFTRTAGALQVSFGQPITLQIGDTLRVDIS